MSVVTEHLEQRGSAFELLPHRQAYTSTDEAQSANYSRTTSRLG